MNLKVDYFQNQTTRRTKQLAEQNNSQNQTTKKKKSD